jgi:hypothetical protein
MIRMGCGERRSSLGWRQGVTAPGDDVVVLWPMAVGTKVTVVMFADEYRMQGCNG